MRSSSTTTTVKGYIPALGYRSLTRFYDLVLRTTMHDEIFKHELAEQANVHPRHRVLDLGCGTASLSILMKLRQPTATVVGLDADPEALQLARTKAQAADVAVELHQGSASDPPFESGSFDRIVSSLFFHHLTLDDKIRALRAAHRLLRPSGELHVADWGKPQNRILRVAFLSVQCLDGFATTRDNVAGRLPELMRDAGFAGAEIVREHATLFGTLTMYRATAGRRSTHNGQSTNGALANYSYT